MSKSEMKTAPTYEEENRSRPEIYYKSSPFYTNREQIHHKANIVTRNQSTHLPDYRSSRAYRTQKPYRERKYNNDPLPAISKTRSERESRPPLHESRHRTEQQHLYTSSKAVSLVIILIFYFNSLLRSFIGKISRKYK